MSDIKVGDLVVVVRGHLCDIGIIFRVSALSTAPAGWACNSCGYETRNDCGVWADGDGGREADGAPVADLRRIPPIEELDSAIAVRERQNPKDLKEPA